MRSELEIMKRHLLQKTEELRKIENEWKELEEAREASAQERLELEKAKMNVEKHRIEVEIALERIQREQEELEKLQELEEMEQQQKLTTEQSSAEENKDTPIGMICYEYLFNQFEDISEGPPPPPPPMIGGGPPEPVVLPPKKLATPKVKMKGFQWKKLPNNKINNTFWMNAQDVALDSCFDELEQLFCVATVDNIQTKAPDVKAKASVVHLLDNQKSNNICKFLPTSVILNFP
jgi:hypothetical protein